jgi:tRNA dimethylallyltransferase
MKSTSHLFSSDSKNKDNTVHKHSVFVITGATATGKSAFGAAFAKKIGGEVVSADSMQIYKLMDIGTAKPTADEMLGVPHHMLDMIMPWEDYSVARYVQDASSCVDDILSHGKVAVIVGGTGLYIDSLLSGRTFSARGDETLRRELELEYDNTCGEDMLNKLREVDPNTAEKLHANDKKRIVRALEIFQTTGKPVSLHDALTKAQPPRYNAVKLAMDIQDRDELYRRIDCRVDMMLNNGLEAEVRGLLDMGVPHTATSMQAIGYKEMVGAISGKCSMSDAIDKIKMESRRYAKRQLTWFRRDAEIQWITWNKTPDIEGAVQIVESGMWK